MAYQWAATHNTALLLFSPSWERERTGRGRGQRDMARPVRRVRPACYFRCLALHRWHSFFFVSQHRRACTFLPRVSMSSQSKEEEGIICNVFFFLSSFPLVWRNPRQMRCNNNNNQRRRILKKSRFISSFFSFFSFWNTIHNRQRDAQLEIRNTTATTNPLWATDVFNF